MGGDCLNTGCVPSKAFIKASKVAHICKTADQYGINIGEVTIDFAKVMERLRKIRAKISHVDSCFKFQKKYDIDIFLGQAEFLSPEQLKINDNTFKIGDNVSKVCIAAGCSPYIPDIANINDFPYFTNENVFNLTEKPQKLVIIGAGPIGCELGQSFARFGTEVTFITKNKNILPKEDEDASKMLYQQMIDDGVKFLFESEPTAITNLKTEGKIWTPN